ncbi:MAG: polyprenyl synthetase family protein [Rubricoccaceae bacterium]
MQTVTVSAADAAARARALAGTVNEALAALSLPEGPASLYAPVRYVLDGGGKRLRPVILLLTAEAFGGDAARTRALPAALAVEVFHNFTLVHDDIMDHAATRRGRPTVHARWDEPAAILAGDFMMGLAYDLLARAGLETPGDSAAGRGDALREALAAFHRMVTRLCEGQALDLAFERRRDVTVDDYLAMIDGKTGALLELCLDLGALAGGAPAEARPALRRAGHDLGRAFQIQDDLLDLTALHADWGKTIGGDLVEGKKTFLLLETLACAEGEERAWFARALDGGLPAADVPEARARMERLGVLARTAAAVDEYAQRGVATLASALPPSTAADVLVALARSLAHRAV